MISSMYWMVPTISGLIVGGFSMGALASMTGGITGRTAKGEAVGAEMGTGSWQSGNARMNNTAMNKHDTALSSSIGYSHSVTANSRVDASNAYNAVDSTRHTGQVGGSTAANLQAGADILGAKGAKAQFGGDHTTTMNQNGTFTSTGEFISPNADGGSTIFKGTMVRDANGKILSAKDLDTTIANADGTTITGKASFGNGKLTSAEIARSDGLKLNTNIGSDGNRLTTITDQNGSSFTAKTDENNKLISATNVGFGQFEATNLEAYRKSVSSSVDTKSSQAIKEALMAQQTANREKATQKGQGVNQTNTANDTVTVDPKSAVVGAAAGLAKAIPIVGNAVGAAIEGIGKATQYQIQQGDNFSVNNDGQVTVKSANGETHSFSLGAEAGKEIAEARKRMESAEMANTVASKEDMISKFNEYAKGKDVIELGREMQDNPNKFLDMMRGNIQDQAKNLEAQALNQEGAIQKAHEQTVADNEALLRELGNENAAAYQSMIAEIEAGEGVLDAQTKKQLAGALLSGGISAAKQWKMDRDLKKSNPLEVEITGAPKQIENKDIIDAEIISSNPQIGNQKKLPKK